MQLLTAEPDSSSTAPAAISAPIWKRPLAIAAALLLFYVLVSFLVDTRGHLSNDVGGKTASVQVMADNQTWDPGLQYWFDSQDPDGDFFPLGFTSQTASGTWINSTTLTMLLPARLLWELGGPRAILLLPILGSVVAAAAARLFHRRLRPSDDGAISMWVVGLASPATIYALDFWEHSWGLALMLLGITWTWDACTNPNASRQALFAGLAFGLAATMRQEALVYGFVAGMTVTALWARQRNWSAMLASSSKMALGAISMIGAHALLELALIGTSSRTSRAGGTLQDAGGAIGELVLEALATTVFSLPSTAVFVWVISLALTASLMAAAVSVARREPTTRPRPALIAVFVAWALWAGIIWILGPNYVPGLFVAVPLASFGVVGAIEKRWFLPAWLGVVGPLPIILITQFQGGAFPQWAGRYHLATAVVLLVMGIIWLGERDPFVFRAILACSLLVTSVGLWLVVDRTNTIGDAAEQITALSEPSDVVVWRDPFNAREFGELVNGRSWLSAPDPQDQRELSGLLQDNDVASFLWLVPDGIDEGFTNYRADGVVGRIEIFNTDIIRMVPSN